MGRATASLSGRESSCCDDKVRVQVQRFSLDLDTVCTYPASFNRKSLTKRYLSLLPCQARPLVSGSIAQQTFLPSRSLSWTSWT